MIESFYLEIYPWLATEDWQETGAIAFGQVIWQLLLETVSYKDLKASARGGVIQANNTVLCFIEIRANTSLVANKKLGNSLPIENQRQYLDREADLLLKDNYQEWKKEIDSYSCGYRILKNDRH